MVGNQWRKKFVLLAVLAAVPAISYAQEPAEPAPAPMAVAGAGGFLEDPISKTLSESKPREAQVRGTVMRVLKGQDALAPNQIMFDSYFKSFILPKMTLTDPKSLEKLPGDRVKFFRDYLETPGLDPVAHEALVVLVLDYMKKVTDGDYHPAVRYNAMIVIGMLNKTEATKLGSLTGRVIADPHPLALPEMMDRYEAKDTLDLVRLAALMGIVRHIEADNYRIDTKMLKEDRAKVLALLVAIATQKEPPSYRNADGQLWMRRKAIEGLGFAMVAVPDENLLKVVDAILQDDEDDLTVRTAAAVALGRVPVNPNVKYNVATGVEELGKLLVDVLQTESNRLVAIREFEASRVGPVSGASNQGGGSVATIRMSPPRVRPPGLEHDPYGLSGVAGLQPLDPKAYRVLASRRLLRGQIHAIELAVKGVDDRAEPKGLPPEQRGMIAHAVAAPKVQPAAKKLQDELKNLAKFLEEETDGLDTKAYEEKLSGRVQLAAATFDAGNPADPAADPMAAPGEVVPGDVPGEVPSAPMARKPPMPAPVDVPGEVPGDVPGEVPAVP